MKRFRFIMDDGSQHDVIAEDFRSACITFDQLGLKPEDITAIQEWERDGAL